MDPLPHLDLARVRDDRPVRMDPDVRMDRVDQLLGRERAILELGRSDERARARDPRSACRRRHGSRRGSADRSRSGRGCRSSRCRSPRRRAPGSPRAATPRPASARAGSSRTARRCRGTRRRGRRRPPDRAAPSTVVTAFPTARSVAVWHDFVLRPSISTVHAAQKPAPQPNFVPCRPSTSRSTHSSGVFACRSSTSTSAPLTTSFI